MLVTSQNSYRLITLAASLVSLSTIAGALFVGKMPISAADVLSALISLFNQQADDSAINTVVTDIRLPRVAAAFIVGAALAAAGAAYQNLFRNPLVSPDILGVSSGAALGAVAGIFLALPILAIQGLAFIGGLVAVGAIYVVANNLSSMRGGHDPILTLVLTGVVIGSLLGSGIALTKYLADPYNQLPAITYWLLGSFASVTKQELAVALPVVVLATLPLVALRWRINLLALPDDEARALGQDVAQLRLIVIVSATLMTAAAVAICGIVGWVGLVVPHAVRLLVGAEFSRLLPLSMLIGGTFMLAVDTLARTMAQIEVPPGVLTAAIGTPAFIWLMAVTYRRRT
ncbi:MAG: iron ABC transporter permease [Aeromicrobium sp.]|nr:iron ABC transporter permease [Burkholderiales bacterium]